MEHDAEKKKREHKAPPTPEDRRDPPGGQVRHEERKGDGERQPEEPHGDSEAV